MMICTKLKKYDLSNIFSADSITDNDNKRFKNPDPLGYIAPNYERFKIHFLSITKSKSNPLEYNISGKTKVKDNVCSFNGTIKIIEAHYDSSEMIKETNLAMFKRGYVTGELEIIEDKGQTGSGVIKGKLATYIYFDNKNNIHYDALLLAADAFQNNQFQGNWVSNKTGNKKRCNWGDFRIPNSGDLDTGSGEFSPNKKYAQNGWQSYNSEKHDEKWWIAKNLIK